MVGTTFGGRYTVLHRVGSGGMAEVYLARDEVLGREVAVKVLNERYANDRAFVERFRREAQSAGSLNHPNIVSLFDYGLDNGTHFIVMEYIDGRSLAEVIAIEGPLLPERAAEIGSDVASALERAHNGGLVHRDIKPSNIMLTTLGQTKVTDFGIARAQRADADATVTQAGVVMGTAAYLSPEQAQGQLVDNRSDIYSLGIVLYEMLTGRPPFYGDTPLSIAYKHVREHAVPPSEVNPHVPASLDAVVMKALSKNPDNRYLTAAEMREDLQRFLSGQKVLATPLLASETRMDTAVSETRAYDEAYVPPPPPRRSRTGLYVLSTFIILALFALVAWFLANNLLGGNEVTVPRLVGLTESEARDRLEGLGLEAETVTRANRRDPGEVFDQNPDEGETVDEDATVTLFVSGGPRETRVPDLSGKTRDEAETLLRDADLELGRPTEEPNDTVEPGLVFEQDPPADEEVPVGTAVDITISSGPGVEAVPNVVSLTEADAINSLRTAGFEVDVAREPSDTAPEGQVFDQDPDAGTEATPGDVVTIVVSEGPATEELPDVTGENADDAEERLESELGLDVSQELADVPCDEEPGDVCDQDPAPGTQVSAGDRVTLFVNPEVPATPTAARRFQHLLA